MMFLWALCKRPPSTEGSWPSCCESNNDPGGVPFGVYAIAQNFNIPIQVQPQIFMTLCLISWAQTLRYHRYARWILTSSYEKRRLNFLQEVARLEGFTGCGGGGRCVCRRGSCLDSHSDCEGFPYPLDDIPPGALADSRTAANL
jgi:hypothetical protein